MNEMVLTDKEQQPAEDIIFSWIGKSKEQWTALFCFIHDNYPDFIENWNYYKDGKSWLLKVTKKKTTIFWLSVIDGAFRVTFYFSDKAEKMIMDSTISSALKEQFTGGKRYNKIRAITIVPKIKKDVENIKTLISIKLSVK